MLKDNLASLEEANAAFGEGDLERAKELFEQLRQNSTRITWSLFNLGRIARAQEDSETARKYYRAARLEDPYFFWNNYEFLAVSLDLNGPVEDVFKTVEDMIKLEPPKGFVEPHFNHTENMAHSIFDTIDKDLAIKVLEYLYRLSSNYAMSEAGLCRLLEACSDDALREEIAQALETLNELSYATRYTLTVYRGKAAGLSSPSPEHDAPDRLPLEFSDYVKSLKRAIIDKDHARTQALRTAAGRFPKKQQHFLELIAEIELHNAEAAADLVYEHARRFGDLPKYPAIRVVYILMDAYLFDRARLILSLLWAHYPEDIDIVNMAIVFLMRSSRHAEAEELYNRYIEGLPDKSASMIRVKAELLEARGELDAALTLLKPFLASEEGAPRNVVYIAIRIAAERRQWDEVFELGLSLLSDEAPFQALLYPLARAARNTGRSRQLYEVLSEMNPPSLSGAEFVRQALFEDLVVAKELDPSEQEEAIDLPASRKTRLYARLRSTDRPVPPQGLNEIYFCADGAYLEPALTSMTSLAMSNMALVQSADMHLSLIVETETIAKAEAGVAPLRDALNIGVDIVDASTILPEDHGLRADYGMATGGHALSVAAYYRIFFAKALAAKGKISQALYIDADTLVRPGLSEIFKKDIAQPIFARSEVERPEIARAASTHGLTNPYFNSGVLLFDFRHPETAACLDRSIHAALDPKSTLFYQDQCALNIGFNGKVGELSTRFNYFITPEHMFSETDGNSVIMHFLDRPKPWDSLYRRNAEEWFNWHRIRHSLLPAADTL